MSATTTSAVLVPVQPVFSDAGRLALAGYLAGYRGLTREAYALDLRQFATWCRARSLPLFAVRRADIESFARDQRTWSPPRKVHPGHRLATTAFRAGAGCGPRRAAPEQAPEALRSSITRR